jgi:hypothetical protein
MAMQVSCGLVPSSPAGIMVNDALHKADTVPIQKIYKKQWFKKFHASHLGFCGDNYRGVSCATRQI